MFAAGGGCEGEGGIRFPLGGIPMLYDTICKCVKHEFADAIQRGGSDALLRVADGRPPAPSRSVKRPSMVA